MPPMQGSGTILLGHGDEDDGDVLAIVLTGQNCVYDQHAREGGEHDGAANDRVALVQIWVEDSSDGVSVPASGTRVGDVEIDGLAGLFRVRGWRWSRE